MATPGKSRFTIPIIGASVLVLVVLGVFGIRSLSRDPIEVRVAPATFQTLLKEISTNGKVEPIEEFQAHAPFPGVIQKIFVNVGDHVTSGQLLVKMDDTDAKARIASSTAALTSAQLGDQNLRQGGSVDERTRFSTEISFDKLEQQSAVTNLTAVQALFAKGAASAAEVTSAQQRQRAADLALANAQQRSTQRFGAADFSNSASNLANMRAGLAAAQAQERNVDIHTPLSGTVYSIPVSQYDYVPGGDDLLDVADLNRIQVRAFFDEPEIGGLARGQAVKIVWEAKPGSLWHGHIERAPTTVITYGTRNVGECIITVDDARGDLLPNTNVTVTVTEMARPNVLSIPREALHTDGARTFVYRILDSKLVHTPVVAGVVNLTSVEIVSGLALNDTVVLDARGSSQELSNGLEVKPVP